MDEHKSIVSSPSGILLSTVFVFLLFRLAYIVFFRSTCPLGRRSVRSLRTLIVLGSGGHTAEMLNLLYVLDKTMLAPRFYVAAATDSMSLQKARSFEESLESDKAGGKDPSSTPHYMKIYRSREVGQSYLTSVGTTVVALAHAIFLLIKTRPQVVICNGPGTCIPICAVAFLLKVVGVRWSYVFYVESIARVTRLSVAGLLLYRLHIADVFFVQWPQLHATYPRSRYVGCLM